MIVASEVPASEFGVKGVKAMTTVSNRPNNTAHFVVDVQAGVLQEAHERDTVDANICSLVQKARREGIQVVWVQHSDERLGKGSGARKIVPELTPSDAERPIEKNYGDSFEETTLEMVLSNLGVKRLVVIGAQDER